MSKNISVCYSHKSDDWKTPTNLYNYLINHDYIDLFPFQSKDNQFELLYKNQKLYINPPFSKLKNIPLYIRELLKLKGGFIYNF